MRHAGRLRSPYHASCADAWPTGNPTVRLAMASASVSSTFVFHPAAKWYAPISASRTPTTSRPWLPLCAAWARQPAAMTRWMVPVIRRLPLSGKTVAPTKFVTSRSSGSSSPPSGVVASVTAATLTGARRWRPVGAHRVPVYPARSPARGGRTRMRPATTLLKSALGEVFHAADVVRNPARSRPLPPLPERATFTIATIGHWFTPDRTQWLVPTMSHLRAQQGEWSIAVITNDPDAAVAALGAAGAGIERFDDPSAAAAYLMANPGSTVALRWTKPRRRTHSKEMSFGHKVLMRSLMW